MSSPNHSTSDIEDAFSSMNILNYTSVSSDYFPASSGSISFNSSENSNDNMIPPVFSSFYNNTYLKDVQAFYAKELPISSPDPITPPAILTPSPVLPPSLLFDPRYFFVPEELLPPKKRIFFLMKAKKLTSVDYFCSGFEVFSAFWEVFPRLAKNRHVAPYDSKEEPIEEEPLEEPNEEGDVRTLMIDEAHASSYLVHSGADKTYYDLRDMYGGHVWKRILLPIVEVGDKVMLEGSFWKDVLHFGKKDMLAPRNYWTDANLHVHVEEIKVDKTLRFAEEPVDIIDREVKSLKRSRIPIVKSIGT
ncbi:hypothetical protein Tco_0549474 [Tanacetum coccineum]